MFNMQALLRSRNLLDPSLTEDMPNPTYPDIASSGSADGSSPIAPVDNTNTQIPTTPNTNTTQQPNPPTKAPYNFADTYKDIQSQQSSPDSAQSKYRDFLANNLPNKSDYAPSKTQRVAAMLSGVSAGLKGKDGFSTARGILDEPYDEALGTYKLQGDKLAKASDLEEKDINNRVKTFRDVEEANSKKDNQDRQNKLTDAQVANLESEMKVREADLGTKGWTFATDKNSGHRIGTKPNSTSPNGFDTLDLGKYDLTTDETIDKAGKEAGAVSNAKLPAELKIAGVKEANVRDNINTRFQNAKALIDFKNANPKYLYRDVPGKGIVAFNPNDPTDVQQTGMDSGKLTDQQKIDLGLAAKIKLKTAPTADKTTVTSVEGNKRTTTTSSGGSNNNNNQPLPPGAKPGGTWIKLPSGKSIYQEPGQ